MSKQKSTSIRINEELWAKAKHCAIDKGITLTELLERALKKEIAQGSEKK